MAAIWWMSAQFGFEELKFGSMGGQFWSQAVSRENLKKVAYFPKRKASFLRKHEGDRGVT